MTDAPILVTGAAGFVGRRLCRRLLAAGHQVHGLAHERQSHEPLWNPAVHWHPIDVRDAALVADLVARLRPQAIYHLAAMARVGGQEPDWSIHDVNLRGSFHVLEAVRHGSPESRTLIVGSAYVFAHPTRNAPVEDDDPPTPCTPYATSKAAADLMAYQYAQSYGLPILRAHPFNHLGPGQGPGFVASDFARRLLALERSGGRSLAVGPLQPVRDFLHVEDVVEAYLRIVANGRPGACYTIASGLGVRIGEILDHLLTLFDFRVELQEVASERRSLNIPYLVGRATRLRQELGWAPTHSWKKGLEEFVQELRAAK